MIFLSLCVLCESFVPFVLGGGRDGGHHPSRPGHRPPGPGPSALRCPRRPFRPLGRPGRAGRRDRGPYPRGRPVVLPPPPPPRTRVAPLPPPALCPIPLQSAFSAQTHRINARPEADLTLREMGGKIAIQSQGSKAQGAEEQGSGGAGERGSGEQIAGSPSGDCSKFGKGERRGTSLRCSCFSSQTPQASRRSSGAPPWFK